MHIATLLFTKPESDLLTGMDWRILYTLKLNSYSNTKVFFHCFLACAVLFFHAQCHFWGQKTKPHMRESDEKMLSVQVWIQLYFDYRTKIHENATLYAQLYIFLLNFIWFRLGGLFLPNHRWLSQSESSLDMLLPLLRFLTVPVNRRKMDYEYHFFLWCKSFWGNYYIKW